MKISRDYLSKNIEINYSILDSKDIVSNSQCSIICLEFKEDKLYMYSLNDGISIKTITDLPEKVELDEKRITVNGASFRNVINCFNCKELTLEIKNGKIVFKNNKQRYTISYRSDVPFPNIEVGNPENAEEIKVESLNYILDKTMFALSKSKETPVFSAIWFGNEYVLGGDNIRFTKIVNETCIKEVAVPASVLNQILSIVSKEKESKIGYYTDGSILYFIINGKYFISSLMMQDEYPSYIIKNIVPLDKKIFMNAEDFMNGVKFITGTINDANHKLFFQLKGDKLIVSTETEIFDGYNEIQVIAQKNTDFQDIWFCLNYKFILDILNRTKRGQQIALEYSDHGLPVNIRVKDEPFIHSISIIDVDKPTIKDDV